MGTTVRPRFLVRHQTWHHRPMVALAGLLTKEASQPLRALAEHPPARHHGVILVDLSGLHHATWEGVEALIDFVERLTERGYDVRLADPQPLVRTALFLTGNEHIPLYVDLYAAFDGNSDGRIDDHQFRL